MACGSLWKNCNQKRRILDIKSKRTKSSLAQLTDSASYSSIRFHLGTYSYCNKQKLTSCILIIPNFVKFRDIIIYVAWWWEKYLSKRSLIKHTCSWRVNLLYPKFPFNICSKNVQDKNKAVQCDFCELWIHIKCNNLNYLDYRYL